MSKLRYPTPKMGPLTPLFALVLLLRRANVCKCGTELKFRRFFSSSGKQRERAREREKERKIERERGREVEMEKE